MDIFIKWDNDEKLIRLPILPSSIEINGSMQNASYNIHNLGEINLKGRRGLYSFSIDSFFPHEFLPIQKGEWFDPYEFYVDQLKTLYEENTTIHLIVTGTDISLYCTIESFRYGEIDGSRDVAYSLQLKEYREIGAEKGTKNNRPIKSIKPVEVSWKIGDTWQSLSKKIYGSSEYWQSIRLNNIDVVTKATMDFPNRREEVALVGYKVVIKL